MSTTATYPLAPARTTHLRLPVLRLGGWRGALVLELTRAEVRRASAGGHLDDAERRRDALLALRPGI